MFDTLARQAIIVQWINAHAPRDREHGHARALLQWRRELPQQIRQN